MICYQSMFITHRKVVEYFWEEHAFGTMRILAARITLNHVGRPCRVFEVPIFCSYLMARLSVQTASYWLKIKVLPWYSYPKSWGHKAVALNGGNSTEQVVRVGLLETYGSNLWMAKVF
jgi:hypothetical protein